MADAFFTEVPERIRFGGLDVDRSAGLQGLRARPAGPRQADGGPPPARRLLLALVRVAGLRHVRRRDARSAVADRHRRPDGRRPDEDGRGLRVLRQDRRSRSTASTTGTSRPKARPSRSSATTSMRWPTMRPATRSGPASGCCGARPTCSPTRATRPAPPPTPTRRCSPTPRRRSSTCSRSTLRLGGENYVLWGGREGYDTLLNTDLAREGAQLARFLHLVAEHKHRIGFSGQLLIEPKPMEPTKHQYDYDVSTVHGFLSATGSRTSTGSTSRPTTPRSPATASTTRWRSPSPTASSAASTPTAATRRTAGTPTSSRTRSRTSRCPSTRSSGPAASRPAASTSTPSCGARAPTGPTSSTPTSAGSTRSPRRCSWRPTWSSAAAWPSSRTPATRAGTVALGAAILDGTETLASLEARVASGEIDPQPVSGHQELLENVVNQSVWASDPSRVTRAPAADRGPRPRHRRLDDGDQGRPGRRSGRRPRRRIGRVRLQRPAPAVERAGPGAVVGRRDRRRSAPSWPRTARPAPMSTRSG